MKLSQWHKERSKPVHKGLYEVWCKSLGYGFALWDGKIWIGQNSDKECALSNTVKSYSQRKQWRGILK